MENHGARYETRFKLLRERVWWHRIPLGEYLPPVRLPRSGELHF